MKSVSLAGTWFFRMRRPDIGNRVLIGMVAAIVCSAPDLFSSVADVAAGDADAGQSCSVHYRRHWRRLAADFHGLRPGQANGPRRVAAGVVHRPCRGVEPGDSAYCHPFGRLPPPTAGAVVPGTGRIDPAGRLGPRLAVATQRRNFRDETCPLRGAERRFADGTAQNHYAESQLAAVARPRGE